MEKETSDRFYQNVKWFDEFFYGLKELYDKISNVLEKEFELSDKSYYYYKPQDTPSIPDGYFLLLGGDDKLKLQISFIFHKDEITNPNFSSEPSLIIIRHDHESYKEDWVSRNIINNDNVKQMKKENEFISGILDWKTEVKFDAFQVPLDLFMEYKDETVKKEIVSKIHEILEIRQKE